MTPSDPHSRLEAWGLARCPMAELERLEPCLARLSAAFTDNRPERYTAYLDDPDTLTAYALYFAPQTVARTEAALRGILARLPELPQRRLRVLDLGCGLGSAALAAAAVLTKATGHAPEVTCLDWSAAALAACAELLPGARTVQGDLRRDLGAGSYDLILSSFAFNEAFPRTAEALAALESLLSRLSPEPDIAPFLLLLEPASRLDTPRFLTLRTRFPDHPLYAPCPHRRTCPLMALDEGFCHDVRRFRPSRATTLLNRRLRRTIADVKFALLAFGRRGGPQAEGFGEAEFLRMVGPMDKAKGVLTCRACMGDGALCRVEVPSAALTSARRHELLARERGDCAWLDGPLEARRRLQNGQIQRAGDLRFTDEAPLTLHDEPEDDTFSFSI